MNSATVRDLGKHAGHKADEAIATVAQLVDGLDEKAVLQTYAATMVCATLVACAAALERHNSPSTFRVDEAFVRQVMEGISELVVSGVMLGEQILAEKGVPR